MMKNWFKVLVTAIITVSMLAVSFGCRVGGDPGDGDLTWLDEDLDATINANIDPDTEGEISIAIMAQASEEAILNSLIADFNIEYPNIEVKVEKISGNYISSLLSRPLAGTMTDLFWMDPTYMSIFEEARLPFNLNGYIEASDIDMDEDYLESATKTCKVTDKGYYLTMPRDYNQMCMYYNKAILREAGVAEPTDDWTWEDFMTIAGQIKETNAVTDEYPVLDGQFTWESTFYTFIRSYGGEVVNADGEVVLDAGMPNNTESNPTYQFLNDMIDWANDGIVINSRSLSSGASFNAGKSAFFMHSRPILSSMYDILGDDLGIVAFPKIGNNPQVVGGSTGYGIYRESTKKDLAWAFLKYMIGSAGQTKLSASGNILPCKTSMLESPTAEWRNYPVGATGLRQDAFVANFDRGITVEFLNYLPSGSQELVLGYLRTMIDAVILDKHDPAEEIIACAEKINGWME